MLTLSAPDRALLHEALRLMGSPLQYRSVAEWRAAVLRTLLSMFGADAGGFVLPFEGEEAATLLGRPPELLHDFLEHQSRAVLIDAWRARDFEASNLEMLTGGDRSIYTKSEIYDLVWRPHRIEDTIKIAVDLTEDAPIVAPGRRFAPGGQPIRGMLTLYADSPGRERFGKAGLDLMRILQPMLRSAVQTWNELAARRSSLTSLIDESSDGLALYDADNRMLHSNRALDRMVVDDRGAEALLDATTRLARSFAGVMHRGSSRPEEFEGAFERVVESGGRRWVLRATRADSVFGRDAITLVRVRPQVTPIMSEAQLARRFGLTRREAEVAALLGAGASNKEIVSRLGVTEFTARRHTENVLRKLQIDSRAKVAGKLRGG